MMLISDTDKSPAIACIRGEDGSLSLYRDANHVRLQPAEVRRLAEMLRRPPIMRHRLRSAESVTDEMQAT